MTTAELVAKFKAAAEAERRASFAAALVKAGAR
jgi:hypothetical protein